MEKKYIFKLKKIDEYDEQQFLSEYEKATKANLLSHGEIDIEKLIHNLWDKNISIVACTINNSDCILQIVCDNSSYTFISNIINSFDNNLNCSFIYDGVVPSFVLKFDLRQKEEVVKFIRENLNNNFYGVNNLVVSAYNLFLKIGSKNRFELVITSPSDTILKVRSLSGYKTTYLKKQLIDCIEKIEKDNSIEPDDYICDGNTLRKIITMLPVIKPMYIYEKEEEDRKKYSSLLTLPLDKQKEVALKYCEGNKALYELLLLLWDNGLYTIGCCGGHYYEDNGEKWSTLGKTYLSFIITNETGIQIANCFINLLKKYDNYGLKFLISGPHPYTSYLDFSLFVSRKYCDEIFKELRDCIEQNSYKIPNSPIINSAIELVSQDFLPYFNISVDNEGKFIKIYGNDTSESRSETLSDCIESDEVMTGVYSFDSDLDRFIEHIKAKKIK